MIKITNENALIASLIGSQAVKSLPRFAAVENELAKRVTPPIPFLPIRNETGISTEPNQQTDGDIWMNDPVIPEDRQFFPFSFKKETEENYYLLPWEPLINISVRNIVAKRYVAKSGSKFIGTIKERFATDDFEITITGAFYGQSMVGKYPDTYPREDMERLRDYLLTPKRLQVKSEPLQILGINYLVIEEVNFPFTKGENVQAYEIKAVSDFDWSLFYQKPTRATLEIGDVEIIDWNQDEL